MTIANEVDGDVLGSRYRIVSMIGRGGMAVVYKAIDEHNGEAVAVKLLRVELTNFVSNERFAREIKFVQQLDHPNIVRLIDSGIEGHASYYVMPFVESGTLRDRIARKAQMTVEETLLIARAVASALVHAHKAGIIHRDIKPENILLDGDHVLVSDFGIARLLDVPGIEKRLSTTGLVIGTPAYMSPEQAAADPRIDPRSDIYSVGCVMYEMLAGTTPFTGATPQAVAARHMVEAPPPLRVVRPNVPEQFTEVIEKCLAKSPGDRFQSAEELLEALLGKNVVIRKKSPTRIAKFASFAVASVTLAGIAWFKATPGTENERIVVVPFVNRGDSLPSLLTGEKVASLLYDALRPVKDVQRVDRLRLESEMRSRGVPSRLDSVLGLSRDLGAGRVVWGEVVRRGDSVFVYAQVYKSNQAGTEPEVTATEAFNLNEVESSTGSASTFYSKVATLARKVITNRAQGEFEQFAGTDMKSALIAKLSGDSALAEWNLQQSRDLYERAVAIDPLYAQASLGLALTGLWMDLPTESWKARATEAVARSAALPSRDRISAAAMAAIAEGQFPKACSSYRELLRRDSTDFEAWFGLGECEVRDDYVEPDPSGVSRYRFRGSFARAEEAYERALRIVPLSHRADRSGVVARLRRVLPTSVSLRRGVRDSTVFLSWPLLKNDSISFAPRPFTDVAGRNPSDAERASTRALTSRNAQKLRTYSAEWIRTFPRSPEAWHAHAAYLELTRQLEGDSLSSAIFAAQRARQISNDPKQELRYGVDLLRLQARVLDANSVKTLSRELLSDRSIDAESALLLAPVAALIGDKVRLRQLLNISSTEWPFTSEMGRQIVVPKTVAVAAMDLFWYSLTGQSSDSLAVFENTLDSELRRWAPLDSAEAREALTFMPALFGFPVFSIRPAHLLPNARAALVMQRDFTRHSGSAKEAAVANARQTINRASFELPPEVAYLAASILRAVDDSAAVRALLLHSMGSPRDWPTSVLSTVQAPAALRRCLTISPVRSESELQRVAQFLEDVSR